MIEIKHLTKTFETSDGKLDALNDVSLKIDDGEIYGIIGMSGAGKSTLVRCINMLERPTQGSVIIDGVDVGSLSDSQLRNERRQITMIFQGFNLLMQRTCLKNVCFPMELAGVKKSEATARAKELLETVGLGDKLKSYPVQLSGGQQQRVAIARALATHPKILLCDEATSALDPQTTQSILSLIRDIHDKLGITVIVITHQMSVVEQICTRVAILDRGTVVEEGKVSDVLPLRNRTPQSHWFIPTDVNSMRQIIPTKALYVLYSTALRQRTSPSLLRWQLTRASPPIFFRLRPVRLTERLTAICFWEFPAAKPDLKKQ